MLSTSKISKYKIKKILTYFVEDYSSTEASKLSKLNRKTINRYYSIFRNITRRIFFNLLHTLPLSSEYIGYIEGEYGPKCFLNIHKVNKKVFLVTMLPEKPPLEKHIIYDKDFDEFARFAYSRLPKFHGFSRESYYFQSLECVVRYNYAQSELFNYIWDYLHKNDKKELVQKI